MDEMNQNKNVFKWHYVLLWILSIIGYCALFPYIFQLGILPEESSTLTFFLMGVAQTAIFYGIICYLSSKIIPKTDLDPFSVTDYIKQIIAPGIIFGTLVGLILIILEKSLFKNSAFSGLQPPAWTGALASFYGAVNEEVFLRLFLFSLIYFLFGKCCSVSQNSRSKILWGITIFVALIFGLGHLPAAAAIAPLSEFEVFRVLLLNGVAGLVFGWLFWNKGLWTAMLAHFIADLMIHVLAPFISTL